MLGRGRAVHSTQLVANIGPIFSDFFEYARGGTGDGNADAPNGANSYDSPSPRLDDVASKLFLFLMLNPTTVVLC